MYISNGVVDTAFQNKTQMCEATITIRLATLRVHIGNQATVFFSEGEVETPVRGIQ